MKNLNRNQWVGVCAGLGLVSYILFAGPIMNFLNPAVGNAGAEGLQTGFTVEDTVVGTGLVVEPGDTLTVHYVGTLEDGKVFDSSIDTNTPFTFTIGSGGVIRGWEEGLVGMRVGGKRILVIDPAYAYGAQGSGTIPPNATLKFEVELLDVQKLVPLTQ